MIRYLNDWSRNKDTRAFIDALSADTGIVESGNARGCSIDTVIRYDSKTQRLTWETQNQQSKISHITTLSISDDLPVRLFAKFDTSSFIRVYAGTKDDN